MRRYGSQVRSPIQTTGTQTGFWHGGIAWCTSSVRGWSMPTFPHVEHAQTTRAFRCTTGFEHAQWVALRMLKG